MSGLSSSPGSPDDRRGRLVGLIVLSFAAFVALTTELATVGLLTAISKAFHQTAASTGLLVSVYAAMVVLFSVPLALLTRRVSGRRMLLIALVGYTACNLLTAVAPTFAVLIAARCVGGIAHAVFFAACIGQAARLASPGRSARAFAIVTAGVSAGYVLGSPLTTALGEAGGWRVPFWALVALTSIALVLLVWLLPRGAQLPPSRPDVAGRLRGTVGVITANGFAYLGQYVLYTYVTVLLLHAGLPRSAVALALLVFGLAGLVTIWATAPLLERRLRWTSFGILITVAASMVAIGASTTALVPLLIIGAVWGAAYGPFAALFQNAAILSGDVGPEVVGAWINTTSNVGIAAGALLGGIVLDQSGVQVLAWWAAIPVVAAAVIVAVAIPRRAL